MLNLLPSMAQPALRFARERSYKPLFLLAMLCLIGTACSTISTHDQTLLEDPRGAVSLRAISDPSTQASHPIHLDVTLIAQVLSGMRVQERHRALQELLGGSDSVPVFSAEDVQFLAPRIAKALTVAGTGEAVAFLLTSPRHNTGRLEHVIIERTAGSLYAYGLSLYVTLSQYRYAPTQASADRVSHRRLPDPSNLSTRTLLFTPSAAQRSDTFQQPAGIPSTDRLLVIDYQLVQQTPVRTATSTPPAPPVEQGTPHRQPLAEVRLPKALSYTAETPAQQDMKIDELKDLVIKKNLELEAIRKELQSVRKQLESQTRKRVPQHK